MYRNVKRDFERTARGAGSGKSQLARVAAGPDWTVRVGERQLGNLARAPIALGSAATGKVAWLGFTVARWMARAVTHHFRQVMSQ